MKKALPIFMMVFALSMTWLTSMAQTRIITGNVRDVKGEPMSGVSIAVKSTAAGTFTDEKGAFSLAVPANGTMLVFTYVGFKTQEIPITASNLVNVSMEEDLLGLDAVVITALGISKEKKSLGYSSQQVGGDEIAGSGEMNTIQALSSKFSGVQVTGSGGSPGSSSKVIIRGPTTFTNSNQPLIVIDGVPMDNSTDATVAADYPFDPTLGGVNNGNRALDINPDDIESVNILKGPTATALYGSRAGSGVILITTKRGNGMGAKTMNFNYNTSLQFNKVNKLPEVQNIYAQGNNGGKYDVNGVVQDEGTFLTGDPGPDNLWFTGDDVSLGTPNNWGPKISSLGSGFGPFDNAGNFFETGITYSNNFSISSSNQNNSFRFSLGNDRETGIVPNTLFRRTSLRVNTDHRITGKLTSGVSVNYINDGGTRAQNGSNLSGVMLSLMRAPESYDLSAGYELPSGDNRNYYGAYDNPYWTINNNPQTNSVNRVIGNVHLHYDACEWMNIDYRLGTDFYSDQRKQIFAIFSNDPANAPGGQIEEDSRRFHSVYSDLLFNFNKKLSNTIGSTLTLGNNLTQEYSQDLYSRGRDLTIPKFYNLSNASDLYSSESQQKTRNGAVFAQLGLDWKSTIFLNLSGRNEWSSTWGPDVKSTLYPSVNTSIVFSEWLPKSKVFSYGKLRLAYAKAGINPQAYSSATYFIQPLFTDGFTDGFSFPYLGQSGFGYTQLNILGNPDLRPEKQIGREIGLELKFFNGRINFDFTYYSQLSQDLLVVRPIAATSGFSYVYANAGEMKNNGIEMTLDVDVLKVNEFTWNITGNFSKNKNEVTKIADGLTQFNIQATFGDPEPFAIVGQPYGVFYGSGWKRNPDGRIIIDATNGLPVASDTALVLGNPYPDWLANFRNTFSWKGFSLTALIDIRHGGDIWGGTLARMNRIGKTLASGEDRSKEFTIDGVVEQVDGDGNVIGYIENTKAVSAFDYYSHYVGDGAFGVTENAIFDGSWVRLRELGLSYMHYFKNAKTPMKSLTFTITGRNVWLHTKYPGVDPETSLTGAGSNVQGYDYFNMPSTKSWMFGLNLGF